MIETIQSVNHLLGIGGIIALIASALLAFDLYHKRILTESIANWGLKISLLLTTSSVVLTLIYSEYFGIIPCGLCWLERIALYPQVLLLAVALYYKDVLVARYGIALSVFGLVVSLYHHYIQMGGSQFIKCPASGAGDCAKRFLFEFNFVTFPLLSAILFGFLIILYIYILKTRSAQ